MPSSKNKDTTESRIPAEREVPEKVPPYCHGLENIRPAELLPKWETTSGFDDVDWNSLDDVDNGPYSEYFSEGKEWEWKRPADIWPDNQITLKPESIASIDLWNVHIPEGGDENVLQRKVVDFFSQLQMLNHLIPSFEEDNELLWNAIQPSEYHAPENGQKYYIRVYFNGFWRCLAVDDSLPVDEDGKCAFPFIDNDGEILLWLTLLFKAKLWLESKYLGVTTSRNLLHWTQSWIPSQGHDAATEAVATGLHAPRNIDWGLLKKPNIADYVFQSWEEFNQALKTAEDSGDEDVIQLLQQAQEEAESSSNEENSAEQNEEKQPPIDKKKFLDRSEQSREYLEEANKEMFAEKPYLLILTVQKTSSVYAHVRETVFNDGGKAREFNLGFFTEDPWSKQKVELIEGTTLVVSEYFLPNSDSGTNEPPSVRLSGITGKDGMPNMDLEQTFWVALSSLDFKLSEKTLSAEIWLNPLVACGKYSTVLSDNFEWCEEFPEAWSRSSKNETMSFYLKPDENSLEEDEIESENEVVPKKRKVVFYFTPYLSTSPASEITSTCRIYNTERMEYLELIPNLFTKEGQCFFSVDSKHPCMEIELVEETPYLIQLETPIGGTLRSYSSCPIFLEPLNSACTSCFGEYIQNKEVSGECLDPVLAGEWCIISRFRISPGDDPSDTIAKFAGVFTLEDAKISKFVEVLRIDLKTGSTKKLNDQKIMNQQWIRPEELTSACDIIVILKAPSEHHIKPGKWSINVISTKQLGFEILDVSRKDVFTAKYLPNRNRILFRDKVTIPAIGGAFSLRLCLSNEQVKIKLQILNIEDIQSEPSNDEAIESLGILDSDTKKLLYETESNIIHLIPGGENLESFILQAVIISENGLHSDKPYWDMEQVPVDQCIENENKNDNLKAEGDNKQDLSWNLFTSAGEQGISLIRDTVWETKFMELRASWESNSQGRSNIAQATRLRFLGEHTQADAINEVNKDEAYEQRLLRRENLGTVDVDPINCRLDWCPAPKTDEEKHFLKVSLEGLIEKSELESEEDFESKLETMKTAAKETFLHTCFP